MDTLDGYSKPSCIRDVLWPLCDCLPLCKELWSIPLQCVGFGPANRGSSPSPHYLGSVSSELTLRFFNSSTLSDPCPLPAVPRVNYLAKQTCRRSGVNRSHKHTIFLLCHGKILLGVAVTEQLYHVSTKPSPLPPIIVFSESTLQLRPG